MALVFSKSVMRLGWRIAALLIPAVVLHHLLLAEAPHYKEPDQVGFRGMVRTQEHTDLYSNAWREKSLQDELARIRRGGS